MNQISQERHGSRNITYLINRSHRDGFVCSFYHENALVNGFECYSRGANSIRFIVFVPIRFTSMNCPNILLIGPPGAGKSSTARSLAEKLNSVGNQRWKSFDIDDDLLVCKYSILYT